MSIYINLPRTCGKMALILIRKQVKITSENGNTVAYVILCLVLLIVAYYFGAPVILTSDFSLFKTCALTSDFGLLTLSLPST